MVTFDACACSHVSSLSTLVATFILYVFEPKHTHTHTRGHVVAVSTGPAIQTSTCSTCVEDNVPENVIFHSALGECEKRERPPDCETDLLGEGSALQPCSGSADLPERENTAVRCDWHYDV